MSGTGYAMFLLLASPLGQRVTFLAVAAGLIQYLDCVDNQCWL